MKANKILLIILVSIKVTAMAASSALGCYAVIVGKDASKDGSLIFGHNEQNGGNRIINLQVIPRIKHKPQDVVKLLRGGTLPEVSETYSFIWSENPGLEFSDTYINEWGVAVASNGCRTREDSMNELVARGEIVDGGIGYLLRRLIIQRAQTAREGVQIAGELLDRFGYSDSGRTLVIADANEAWLLSIVRGKHWVAQKVADDEVALLPNVHIISEIDLSASNFMGTPDIVDYAIRRGWFKPTSNKPFSFRAAYNQSTQDQWDMRQWLGQCLVCGKSCKLPSGQQLPFSVKPEKKLTVRDVIKILRYHGQRGTICGSNTQEAAVFQLRNWLPPQIGCIYWRTSAEPCSGVLIPWYLGITETPLIYYKPVDSTEPLTLSYHFNPPPQTFDYDPNFAWWTFKTLQEVVNQGLVSIKRVRAVFDDFELKVFANQSLVETEALSLSSTDKDLARLYLTNYSKELVLKASYLTIEMIEGQESVVVKELKDKDKATWGKMKRLLFSTKLPRDYRLPTTNSLLQNYPNPFNPETWIPYQLAKEAEVKIRIYNLKGQLIRDINLGHQQAGFYISRKRAAHWNGRTETGQPASSGLYFYTIKAGNLTATQRMLLVQ